MRRRLPPPLRTVLRAARARWRRSLQLRVVAATVALGLIVIVVVGQLVLKRISDGLVQARVESATAESAQLLRQARDAYDNKAFTDEQSFSIFLNDLVAVLQGSADRQARYVIATKALGTASTGVQDRASQGIEPTAIPDDLRRRVSANPDYQSWKLLTVPVRDPEGNPRTIRAVAVGGLIDFGPIGGGDWELYFVHNLDREVTDLGLVQRTLIIGEIALLLLVGASAWVVTRQVVSPVRQAARTAEQLASGRLDRRMRVRGEDELARLGRGFNEMAASLERQILQLEELSRVQRRFVSDVSHELRTPLTTIRMAGELIYEARDDFDPAIARSAELLQAQLDRFEALLADLLEVSRFDAGAAVLETEPTDLREVAVRVVDGLRPLADLRGSVVEVVAPNEPCVAEIDIRRVERIVRNLVGNAVEHGEGGPIRVSVAADGDAVALAVRDHGVGLRPGELRMVFNRFWRADPARARTTGGTGLGLAIALEDAHLHGGWLQVWGEPGKGANFRLTLPRRAGVVLAASPLPLVPQDVPLTTPDGDSGSHVALVVASDGASVLSDPTSTRAAAAGALAEAASAVHEAAVQVTAIAQGKAPGGPGGGDGDQPAGLVRGRP